MWVFYISKIWQILKCFSGYHVENKPLIKKDCTTVTGCFSKFEPVPQI